MVPIDSNHVTGSRSILLGIGFHRSLLCSFLVFVGSSSISPSSVIVSYVSLAFVLVILFLICQNNWDFAPPVFISLSARSRVFSLISFSSCYLSTFGC